MATAVVGVDILPEIQRQCRDLSCVSHSLASGIWYADDG